MELRLGDLLIESGVLNEAQVQQVLAVQADSGEPFGVIAERDLGVHPSAIEAAWARQYAGLTRSVDLGLEVYEEKALALVSRRQAWQFRVLPVRFEPHELMIATTVSHLPRALRFAANVIGFPVFFVMAEPEALGIALCRHYALPGFTPDSVVDPGVDKVLGAEV